MKNSSITILSILLIASSDSRAFDFDFKVQKDLPDKVISQKCPEFACEIFRQPPALRSPGVTDRFDGWNLSDQQYRDSALDWMYANYDDPEDLAALDPDQSRNATDAQLDTLRALNEENQDASFYEHDRIGRMEFQAEMEGYVLLAASEYLKELGSMTREEAERNNDLPLENEEMVHIKTADRLLSLLNNSNDLSSLSYSERAEVLSLWRSIKRRWRQFTRWVARQTFELEGQPSLEYLIVQLNSFPDVDLANPLRLRGLRVQPIFKIVQRYRFLGRSRTVSISSQSVEISASAQASLASNADANTVQADARFSRLRVRFSILGFRVRIGLTNIANSLIARNMPVDVFDANKILAPLDPLGLKVGLQNFTVPVSSDALRIQFNLRLEP